MQHSMWFQIIIGLKSITGKSEITMTFFNTLLNFLNYVYFFIFSILFKSKIHTIDTVGYRKEAAIASIIILACILFSFAAS